MQMLSLAMPGMARGHRAAVRRSRHAVKRRPALEPRPRQRRHGFELGERRIEQPPALAVPERPTESEEGMMARTVAAPTVAACGCGIDRNTKVPSGRSAVAVDPDIKERNLKRLRRIEGQVRGIHKMVEEDRYCADIVTQVSAVHEALRSVSRGLMRNHLKHCATRAIRGTPQEADAMYDELIDMMFTHSR